MEEGPGVGVGTQAGKDDDGGGARLGGAAAHDGDDDEVLITILFLIGLFSTHGFIILRYHILMILQQQGINDRVNKYKEKG